MQQFTQTVCGSRHSADQAVQPPRPPRRWLPGPGRPHRRYPPLPPLVPLDRLPHALLRLCRCALLVVPIPLNLCPGHLRQLKARAPKRDSMM
jgi:hypothetical protein